MVANIVQDVIDDLSSRQALAGAASVLYIAAFVGGWAWWVRRVRNNRGSVDAANEFASTRPPTS